MSKFLFILLFPFYSLAESETNGETPDIHRASSVWLIKPGRVSVDDELKKIAIEMRGNEALSQFKVPALDVLLEEVQRYTSKNKLRFKAELNEILKKKTLPPNCGIRFITYEEKGAAGGVFMVCEYQLLLGLTGAIPTTEEMRKIEIISISKSKIQKRRA